MSNSPYFFMLPSELFKNRLKSARELRSISQSDLGRKAGLPISSIAHFESGSRKPSFDSLRKLAIALEVTTDFLLGTTDNPSLSESGDPLFRSVSQLSDKDRELAKDFLSMLASRSKTKWGNGRQ